MRRFLTVLEGPGKGAQKPLDQEYMLVGRSHVADVPIEGDDLLISRRHLEVRIRDGAVFVKDISSKGSLLNGQRVKGEVSLNAGDVLELGHTKLQYGELDGNEALPDATQPMHPVSPENDHTRVAEDRTRVADDRTRVAASVPDSRRPGEDEASPDATHAAVDDHTRMLNPAELPGWKAPVRKSSKSNRIAWMSVVLASVLATAGGTFWFLRHGARDSNEPNIEFKDSEAGFRMEYPSDWSRMPAKPDVTSFGFGDDTDPEWARVNIYADKNPRYSITGLSYGFNDWKETLRNQFPGSEFLGSDRRTVNEVEVVFFGFGAPALEGVGFYLLNGDARIVIECFHSRKSNQRFAPTFNSMLKSFRLTTGEPQQFIDFPLPEGGMKRLALSDPAELSREVDEHSRRGDALVIGKDVSPENLYRSLREYRQALQLAVAGPQPLPAYRSAAEGLRRAVQLYYKAVQEQRFEMNRAMKANDQKTAYWAATRMMQMVPDKSAPAYQEAYRILRSVEVPK